MKPIITVENLSKQYSLGEKPARTLREVFERFVSRPEGRTLPHKIRAESAGRGSSAAFDSTRAFWALKDVSFEIKPGEIVGVIGRNGAGKSTLLKILSKITEPTSGRAVLRGRVASLLEVGTGFHPDLTGRENIYLNGTILGMRKREIDKKLDEIIDFSEIENFLDTPVKRYSSGMYVRLAFAVAAHLEAEIMFIDEVLSVGDFTFQKKCLGKIGEVTKSGRTVMFVSHNLAAVEQLCPRALLLANGVLAENGGVQEVISEYLKQNTAQTLDGSNRNLAQSPDGAVELVSIDFLDQLGAKVNSACLGKDLQIKLSFKAKTKVSNFSVSIGINTSNESRVTLLHSQYAGAELSMESGENFFYCNIQNFPLAAGRYLLDIKAYSESRVFLWAPAAAELLVAGGDFYSSGSIPDMRWAGVCFLNQKWGSGQHGK